MQSQAKDVATFIQQAPSERREAVTNPARLFRKVLKGFDEGMAYGGPSYGPERRQGPHSIHATRQDRLRRGREAVRGHARLRR